MTCWLGLFRSRLSRPSFMQRYPSIDGPGAMQSALAVIEEASWDSDLCTEAMEALFRLQLLFGDEQDAEELIGDLNRRYSKLNKKEARWLIAINGAILELHRYRPARAAELVQTVLISSAPRVLQFEATVLLAAACVQGAQIDHAERLLNSLQSDPLISADDTELLDAIRIDLIGRTSYSPLPNLGHPDFDAYIAWRAALSDSSMASVELQAKFLHFQQMCLSSGATSWSESARIDVGTRLVDSEPSYAESLLRPLLSNEAMLRAHARRDELLNCQARILAKQGRYALAFDILNQYIVARDDRIKRGNFSSPGLRTDDRDLGAFGEALSARLPPRYRRLMGLFARRLSDPKFGVVEMAAYLNVSERAVQMTLKKHLGLSPAQLIREVRRQGLAEAIPFGAECDSSGYAVQHWGFKSVEQARSALGANQRFVFSFS